MKNKLTFVCMLLLSASHLQAQTPIIAFEKVFDQFSSISVWSSPGLTKPGGKLFEASDDLVIRYGFELGIGPYPQSSHNPLIDSLNVKIRAMETDSIIQGTLDPKNIEYLAKLRGRKDFLEGKDRAENNGICKLTVGVGLDHSNGYRFDLGPLNIKAPIRGYYLAVYLTEPEGTWFHGLLGGFFDLSGATAYKDADQYKLTSSTFSFEIIPIGASLDIGSAVSGTVELSWRYLVFEGVRYEKVESTSSFTGPSRLNFSAIQLTVGLELGRKK